MDSINSCKVLQMTATTKRSPRYVPGELQHKIHFLQINLRHQLTSLQCRIPRRKEGKPLPDESAVCYDDEACFFSSYVEFW